MALSMCNCMDVNTDTFGQSPSTATTSMSCTTVVAEGSALTTPSSLLDTLLNNGSSDVAGEPASTNDWRRACTMWKRHPDGSSSRQACNVTTLDPIGSLTLTLYNSNQQDATKKSIVTVPISRQTASQIVSLDALQPQMTQLMASQAVPIQVSGTRSYNSQWQGSYGPTRRQQNRSSWKTKPYYRQ